MDLQLPPPHDEVLRLHVLLKQARKRKLENRPIAMACSMDNMDTLPYEAGPTCAKPQFMSSLFLIDVYSQLIQVDDVAATSMPETAEDPMLGCIWIKIY